MSLFNWFTEEEHVFTSELSVKCEVLFPFMLMRMDISPELLLEICTLKTPDGRFVEVRFENEVVRRKDGWIGKYLYLANPAQERFVYDWVYSKVFGDK